MLAKQTADLYNSSCLGEDACASVAMTSSFDRTHICEHTEDAIETNSPHVCQVVHQP